jgi:hypothetical protein
MPQNSPRLRVSCENQYTGRAGPSQVASRATHFRRLTPYVFSVEQDVLSLKRENPGQSPGLELWCYEVL